jgi:hypothetical protein
VPPATTRLDIKLDLIVAPETARPFQALRREPKVHGAEMGIEFQATLSIPNDWRFGTALAIGRDPAGANRIQAMLSDLAGGEW